MADIKITELGAVQALTDSHVSIVDNGTTTNKASMPQMRNYMVGDLTSLLTTVKTSIVAAINEIVGKITNKVLYYEDVACSATTGDFATITDSKITADHELNFISFANSSAITSSTFTVTTSAGSCVVNGTCASATTLKIGLIKKDN